MRISNIAAAAIFTLLVSLASTGFADEPAAVYENEAAGEIQSLSAADLTDEQLERYVEAKAEIASIRLRHADEIASRGGETVDQAQQEMAAAIEDHGLTVREYREIARLVRTDGGVSKRVKRVEARRQ